MTELVLSIFPGIDLFGRAFEEAGYCVVRGPDLIFGGDIRQFHPPPGRFEGVIGGPPCVGESTLAHLNGTPGRTMIGEFLRIVEEAQPRWWVMEAVKRHPIGNVVVLNPRWLGEEQSRRRFFHSNLDLAPYLEVAPLEPARFRHAVLAEHGGTEGTVVRGMATYTWAEMLELQGLPPDFELPDFTVHGRRKVVGSGVPLCMGRAIARAVRAAGGGKP